MQDNNTHKVVSPAGPSDLRRKSESRLHRLIARLPGMPDNYMRSYWTTIGHTIAVPAKYDGDLDWGTPEWRRRHNVIIGHEHKHIWRMEQWGWPLYTTAYLGPAVVLAPLVPLAVWLVGWWALAGWAALLPLSAGLAYGRWYIEREAYLIRMRQLRGAARASFINRVVDNLWSDYVGTWPKGWMRKWFNDNATAK